MTPMAVTLLAMVALCVLAAPVLRLWCALMTGQPTEYFIGTVTVNIQAATP